MQEYVTRAVVLDKETRGGHADARYSFFTERFGKVRAKATSSRKIVSKLAGHLEPGTLSAIRIVEQHGTRVVDALTTTRTGIALADLARLDSLLGEWQPEAELWQELVSVCSFAASSAVPAPRFSWARALTILGWDPRGAVCAQCSLSDRPARHFYVPRQEFFCDRCINAFMRNRLLLIDG